MQKLTKPEAVGPVKAVVLKGSADAPYIIYLHGYGGIGMTAYEDMEDEIQKSKVLKTYNWIFPDAPAGLWFSILANDPQVAINRDKLALFLHFL